MNPCPAIAAAHDANASIARYGKQMVCVHSPAIVVQGRNGAKSRRGRRQAVAVSGFRPMQGMGLSV
jgi:hypothetical protein